MFSKGDIFVLSLMFIFGAILYQPIWRFIVFTISTDITYFSGRWGLKRLRAKLERARLIIDTPDIPIDIKYIEAVDAVIKSCQYLGGVMDQFNLKQGTAPYLRDLKESNSNKKEGGEKKNDGN